MIHSRALSYPQSFILPSESWILSQGSKMGKQDANVHQATGHVPGDRFPSYLAD